MIKKISFAFFVLIFLILLFNTNVYAAVEVLDFNEDVVSSATSNANYPLSQYGMWISKDKNDNIVVRYYDKTLYPDAKAYIVYNGQFTFIRFGETITFHEFVYPNLSTMTGQQTSTQSSFYGSNTTPLYFYSSFDVYTDTSYNTLFFQAPVVEEIQGTIAPLLEKRKMVETMKEIVMILPVIVSVLVSLISLRKAWQVLSNFLRTS